MSESAAQPLPGEGVVPQWRKRLPGAWGLLAGLALAATVRWPLLSTSYVPFNSDEAVVGLMAKHILEGARPVFFYGQAYMGSLDAWLIAGAFRFLGEGIHAIRIVQLVLFLAFIGVLWILIRQMFDSQEMANWGALLAAIPPLLVVTYTTATLGGYGEILVLEVAILLLAHRTLVAERPSLPAYTILGLLGGLAFWTLGLSIVYLLPIGLLHLVRFRRRRIAGYVLALLGFLIGSSPWWLYNWAHAGAALQVLTSGRPMDSTIALRALGLVALGLPALLGLRAPWSADFVPLPLFFAGTVLHLSAAALLWERFRRRDRLSLSTWLLLGVVATFILTFTGTQFGVDATGRYLLPLYPILVMGLARFLMAARRWRPPAAVALLIAFWGMNGFIVWRAAHDASRITTQFDPITRFGNHHDQALISFLEEKGIDRGYSNHWVTYRFAFLTDEWLILSAELPYKADLRYTPRDQRIPGYGEAADRADNLAYVTTKHPTLDGLLASEFAAHGVAYKEEDIGPFHVFHDLTEPLRPENLNLEERGALP